MSNKQIKNNQIRERVLNYWESNYRPELKMLVDVIGIASYPDFIAWKNGNKGYGCKLLSKIEQFLDEKDVA